MKNILFLHSSAELYGSDRSLFYTVKNIDKAQYNVFVILPCNGPLVAELEKCKGVSVQIYDIAVLRRKNLSIRGAVQYIRLLRMSCKYIRKFINENHIDVVDTNTAVVFPGAIAAKRCKVASVWHIREIIKNKYENRFISFMMNRYATTVVANSKATGQALQISSDKLQIIYNAIEEKKVGKVKKHIQFTVGMAGRINRWKGQKLFVDAAKIVIENENNIRFLVAGDAYSDEEFLKTDLVNYIKENHMENSVTLLGQVDNMSEFYNELDIFVLPSIQPEPFGLVLIEAMNFELPVIATRHGGPVEIIDEGVDGFLVDYKNPEEMADRILNLLRNDELRERMGKAGKVKMQQNYSVDVMVKKLESVYKAVC